MRTDHETIEAAGGAFHPVPTPGPRQQAAAGRPAIARPSILILVAIAAISPLAINMYLPSMPGMARALGSDFGTVQLTLSLYFTAIAVGQLVIGSLSDRFGRRPVLIGGLALFIAGSIACALAPSIEALIVARIFQGAGGCAGIVLSRAIVRDVYDRHQAASMLGYVTMGMSIAPMIAPTAGGLLDAVFGWRATFAFLAVAGVATLAAVVFSLRETHRTTASTASARRLVANYADLARSATFWGYTLTTAFTSATFFSFVAGASYVMIELLGGTATQYGLYFGCVATGYLVGNFLSGRYAALIGPNRMILCGNALAFAGVGLIAVLFAAGFAHPMALFGPMLFVGISNGMVLPSAIAGAVSVRPDLAGAASGLTGSVQIGFGAIVTPIVGALLGETVWPLVAVMAACATGALISYIFVLAGRRV